MLLVVTELKSAPFQASLSEEFQERLRRLERNGPWEIGLGAAVSASLLGMLFCAMFGRRQFQLNVETSGVVFFAALLLLLLLAWLARDRARRAHLAQYQTLAEVLQRHVRTEQALRDPLTGAYNRTALEEFAGHSFRWAERHGESLAMAVLDIDSFHELNNKFGHSAGDLALVQFANILQSYTRGSDLVARYGGDEFVLLLAETPLKGVDVVIARIQECLRHRNEHLSEEQLPLAFTAGAALFRNGMDLPTLFAEADRDLIARKTERRTSVRTTANA